MTGTKYLSDAVHMHEFSKGHLNFVTAPVGSGKTHWALHTLVDLVSAPHKMLYLIDTVNGKEQLLKQTDRTRCYSDSWHFVYHQGLTWFGEIFEEDKIVVMTYAKFGLLAEQHRDFGQGFQCIVCDEIHNLPRFSSFLSSNPEAENYHRIAKQQLELLVNTSDVLVIGLSATPKRAQEKMHCPTKMITVDQDVRSFETRQVIPYINIHLLLYQLDLTKKGLVYISHIAKMQPLEEAANRIGIRAIAIWSINNKAHPLNDEQKRVRDYILTHAALPDEYDMVIINASSETSINIFSPIDYIIIHTQEEEPQIQVRGRYRGDLEKLYVLDYNAVPTVPEIYLGIPLYAEEKKELCEILNLRNVNGNKSAWPTAKARIEEAGYQITEGRYQNRRYCIITH